MKLSFFQIIFLLSLFIFLFSKKTSILKDLINLINSFLQSLKKHNSIRK